MKLLPSTKLGKWSVGLGVSFFVLLATTVVVVQVFHQEGGETIFDNLFISIPMLSASICAITAFFTGLVAILKQKERAMVVFLTTGIGFLVLFFVLGELTTPHYLSIFNA